MTHLPNELALKMDGAQACHRYCAVRIGGMSGRVGGRGDWRSSLAVMLGEAVPSADLGGSSKYSNENFED
jgi:hypothetical protein